MKNIYKKIYQLESSLLTTKVRSSIDLLDKILADDFIEFGSSGSVYNKKKTLKDLPVMAGKVKYTMSNFEVKILSEDIVLSTFKTRRVIDKKAVVSLRSSLWRKDGKDWQMFFHQGTPIK
ncbi:MAG: DUF4440 domain-containing protein [Patescibacteria group bacterium]|jgi:hypothetical protein